MGNGAVVNASPLIILSRANRLDLLTMAAEKVLVPEPVAMEIQEKGAEDLTAQAIRSTAWLEVVHAPAIPEAIADWGLGAGESSVLAVAQAVPGTTAILDDFLGRKCAASLGISVRGTLGLVLIAKKRNRITSARLVIDELLSAGLYLSPDIIDGALSRVGE